MEGNRNVRGRIISGVFYIIGADDKSYPRSLTKRELEKYMSMFWEPADFENIDIVRSQIESFFEEYDEYEKTVF